MKTRITMLVLLCAAFVARAEPMTDSVDSWEGSFKIKPHIVIQAEGMPQLLLWLYQLDTGSKGTCIGFSRENGDMILAPMPNDKGGQPIYTGYSVLFSEAGVAQIIVTYDVQGNGRMRMVEEYRYDGKQISLASTSVFHGKHNPVWKKETVEQAATPNRCYARIGELSRCITSLHLCVFSHTFLLYRTPILLMFKDLEQSVKSI